MAKKFSIHDWVYPDGDPIEAWNKRVLSTFCETPQEEVKGEDGGIIQKGRYPLDSAFTSSYYHDQIFLGISGDFDLWLFTSASIYDNNKRRMWVLRYDPKQVRNSHLAGAIKDGPNYANLELEEAYRRAKARGLI